MTRLRRLAMMQRSAGGADQEGGVLTLGVQSTAVMTALAMSRRSSSAGNMGISLVFAPASTWPSTAP